MQEHDFNMHRYNYHSGFSNAKIEINYNKWNNYMHLHLYHAAVSCQMYFLAFNVNLLIVGLDIK